MCVLSWDKNVNIEMVAPLSFQYTKPGLGGKSQSMSLELDFERIAMPL